MHLTPSGKRLRNGILLGLGFVALGVFVWYVLYRPAKGSSGPSPVSPATSQEEVSRQPEPCTGGLLGRPLRVGVVTWPGYAGGIVANNGFKPNADSIFFRQHQLCVELILMEDIDTRAKAFARGGRDGVDVVWSTVDFWANELPGFLKNGVKARAIMQVDWSRGGDAIVADNSIKRIEDLYQKKISLALFTPSHWLLEYSLQSSKLDENQQNEIVRGLMGKAASPDARADFVNGKADAAVVWEPDVEEATKKRQNSHILVSTRDARKLIADLMVAREDFIRDHPDVIQAFVEGWVDGTVEANRNPARVARLLMENEALYRDLGPDVTLKNLATVEWASMADNAEMFNLDGKDQEPLFDRLFNRAAKSWLARGYITSLATPAAARDDRFLRELYKHYPAERIPDVFPKPTPGSETQQPLVERPVTVIFAPNSALLDAAARQVIDDLALQPTVFSGANIRVEGNTDNRGDADHNRELSRRRAQAVVDYLVARYHLPVNQFIVVGNGQEKPLVPNDTEENRAKNRRTEVSVIPLGAGGTPSL